MMLESQIGDLVPLLLILLVGAAAIMRGAALQPIRNFLAKSWMTCQGTVEFGSVKQRRSRYKNFYVGRIDYSYSANGEYFSGHFERVFVREGSANKFVDALQKQMVFVRYKPEKPERSTLLKDDQPGGWPA